MRDIFRPCATFPLVVADVLREEERLIYLDTDMIVLRDIRQLWTEFSKWSDQVAVGISQSMEQDYKTKLPKYGAFGLNSGLIIMNLSRIRELDWVKDFK